MMIDKATHRLMRKIAIDDRVNAAVLNLNKQAAFKMRQIESVKKLSKVIKENKNER